MSITFWCDRCGKEFRTSEGLAGKKAKCKQCGHAFIIPSASALSQRPAAPTTRPKPSPTDYVDPYADLDDDPYAIEEPALRAKPFTYDEDDDLPPPPRAPRPQSGGARPHRRRIADGYQIFDVIPGTVFLSVLGVLALFGVVAVFAPKIGAPLLIGGIVLTILPIYLYAMAGFLILPFRESALHGLACMFVPFYPLYYLVTRWEVMRGPFLNSLACVGMVIVMGVFVPVIASMSKAPGDRIVAEAVEVEKPADPPQEFDGRFPLPPVAPPMPPNFGPRPPFGPPPGFGPGEAAAPPRVAARPDETITLMVSGLLDDETREAFAEKLDQMLRENYQGVNASGRGGGDRMTYKVGPIADDPQSFAAKIDWAEVARINGRTVTVEMAPLSADQRRPAAGDFIAGVLFDLESPALQKRKDALRRLKDAPPDPEHRAEVARAIEPLLRDPDGFARSDAAKALAIWGGPENTPALVEALRDPAFNVRWAVLDAFAQLKDPAGAEGVAEWLPKDRGKASEALKAMGPGAEPAVIPYLEYLDVFTRMEAAKILQVIGTEASVGPLRKLVQQVNGHGLDAMAANEALRVLDRGQAKGRKSAGRR